MRSRLSVLAGRLLIAVARKVGTAKIRGPFGLRKKIAGPKDGEKHEIFQQ